MRHGIKKRDLCRWSLIIIKLKIRRLIGLLLAAVVLPAAVHPCTTFCMKDKSGYLLVEFLKALPSETRAAFANYPSGVKCAKDK